MPRLALAYLAGVVSVAVVLVHAVMTAVHHALTQSDPEDS